MPDLDLISHVVDGEFTEAFEHLRHRDDLCPWCFGRVRSFFPEFDATQRDALQGRKLGGEPAIQVLSATSTASPEAYQDVVPARTDGGTEIVEPAGPKTVCQCGVIDFSRSDNRSLEDRLEALGNIEDRFLEEFIPFDFHAGEQLIYECQKHDELVGQDMAVLERATKLGLKHG